METLNKNILIPVDFGEPSLTAISHAYNLAKINKYTLILLYVFEESGFLTGLFPDSQKEELISKVKIKLDKLADDISKDTGLTVQTMVRKGRIYSEILEVADEINARYIIMGVASKFFEDPTEKRIVGANASKVIRAAKCPVLTVNSRNNYKGCRSILLPLDLTQETRQKVKYAVDIAKAYNASIKTISVIWDVDDKEIRWKMNIIVNQVKNFIISEGIKCTTEIIDIEDSKLCVDTIIDYAHKEGDIDLIVIMTQDETGFIEYFVGSKAQEIIRKADIPVMSITPKEF